MASVQFTKEEFELITHQVNRLMDHKVKSKPRDVRRKEEEFKILQSLKRRLHTAETPLRLDRRDLRGIQSLSKIGVNFLQTTLIPGYQDKISKASKQEDKESLQGYLDRAISALKTHNEILSKIERHL